MTQNEWPTDLKERKVFALFPSFHLFLRHFVSFVPVSVPLPPLSALPKIENYFW